MPKTFAHYAGSPLAALIADALQKASKIKEKYASDLLKPKTAESIAANNIANLVEETLRTLHETVFPAFDEGHAPGLITSGIIVKRAYHLRSLLAAIATPESMVAKNIMRGLPEMVKEVITEEKYDATNPISSIIYAIQKNQAKLFEGAGKIPGPEQCAIITEITAKISTLNLGRDPRSVTPNALISLVSEHLRLELLIPKHPLIYELMEMLAQQIKAAPQIKADPKEFEKFAPFFNPQAGVKVIQSGILGTLISKFGSLKIKPPENQDPEATNYAFDVTTKDSSWTFNIVEYYSRTQDYFLSQLLEPVIRRYLAVHFKDHSENPLAHDAIAQGQIRVESEVARSSILQRLTDIAVNDIHQNVLSQRRAHSHPAEETHGITQLQTLARQLEATNSLLLANPQLREDLVEQQRIYASIPVISLLHKLNATDLLAELTVHQQRGLDVSYTTQPMPELIPDTTNGANAVGGGKIGIHHHIHWAISKEIQELDVKEGLMREQSTYLSAVLLSYWQEECSKYMQAIADFEQDLRELEAQEVTLAESEEVTLENALQSLSIKLDKQQALRQIAMELIQTAQQSISHPCFDSLRTELEGMTAGFMHASEIFIQKLSSSQKAWEKEQRRLRTQIEKHRSAELFAGSLRSADPIKMQQLLSEKGQQLAALQEEHRILRERLAALQANHALSLAKQDSLVVEEGSKREKLTALQTESDTFQAVISSLEQRMSLAGTAEDIPRYEATFTDLCSIKRALESEKKKDKIPFKEIDAIMAFDDLLLLLGNQDTQFWRDCRKAQGNILKRSPSHEVFMSMRAVLLDSLNRKILSIDEFLQGMPEIERLKLLRVTGNANTIEVEKELASIQSQMQETALVLRQIDEERATVSQALQSLVTERETPLTKAQYVLAQFLRVLTDIDQFKPQIELFADNENYDDIPGQVLALQNTAGLLRTQTEDIARVLETLENPTEYQPTLTTIQGLLQQIDQRVAVTAEEKEARRQARASSPVQPPVMIFITEEEEEEDIIPIPAPPAQEEEIAAPAQEDLEDISGPRQAMVQRLLLALRSYQENRDTKYKVKDFFTATDKTSRNLFINQLTQQLGAYAESGDSEQVLQTIDGRLADFPGRNLQSLLHKITADILNFGQELPTDSQRVTDILTAVEQTHPQYVTGLRNLFQKITDMRNYGIKRNNLVIIELANKLKQDAERFIITHGENVPNADNYQAFTRKFHARLHSEDSMLHEEGKDWTYIATNIMLALFLIPKLIYSKLTTGRCAFFAEGTKGINLVESIEDTASVLPRMAG